MEASFGLLIAKIEIYRC